MHVVRREGVTELQRLIPAKAAKGVPYSEDDREVSSVPFAREERHQHAGSDGDGPARSPHEGNAPPSSVDQHVGAPSHEDGVGARTGCREHIPLAYVEAVPVPTLEQELAARAHEARMGL